MGWFGRRRRRRRQVERADRLVELDAAIRALEEHLPRDRRTGRVLIVLSVVALLSVVVLTVLPVRRANDVAWDLDAWIDVTTRVGSGGGPLWFVLGAYAIYAAVFVGGAALTLARPFRDLRRSEAILERWRRERDALRVEPGPSTSDEATSHRG